MVRNYLIVLSIILTTVFLMGCNSEKSHSKGTEDKLNYPKKGVSLVVPFNPGGASDIHTRILEKYFKDEFGQSLTFVYKPGAAGAVGTAQVATMKDEDHTIMVANFPDIVIQPLTVTDNFSIDDFDYIAEVTHSPLIFTTSKNSKLKTLEDLIQAAKKSPGKISIAYAPNSVLHLSILDFIDQAGIDVTLVPYKDGAEAKAMIVGEHVDTAIVNLDLMVEELDQITTLAVTTKERNDKISEIPTFKEQGYEVVSELSRIYVVPKGLSDEKLNRLREGFNTIGENSDYQNDMEKIGQPVTWLTGEELEEKVREYHDYANKLVEKHKLNK
ncbi:hypothetical protein AF332_27795 [Sporosarcina globispora]|uniref:Tripartite tricarboxylate transporter substrate binding protein n=1 Tax=Sporosarcina globispora TaxID=1459 RepID=A0A0M0G266_SPOGL|nr:tripartite tricarboxylate transporter substrate binding protein [Sporosarcina globispora]KON83551.1 hypothetical protein AF332_27795 [Sporosarcina globispora]